MRRILMSTIVLLSGSTLALAPAAAEPGVGLPAEIKENHPGTTGGNTAKPTKEPETSSISDEEMEDHGGIDGAGSTANPTAEPEKGKLVEDPPKTP